MNIPGYATTEGTARFKARFPSFPEGAFREKQGLWFSSIGIGSYLGDVTDADDKLYEEAVKAALSQGVNVLDSAINYRAQRSERNFGKALSELMASGRIKRDEVILCTKGGFIPFEGDYPADASAFIKQNYVHSGILKPEDIAQGCHALTPKYLETQLEKSRANLGVETIDLYYLHNPETQLAEIDRPEFLKCVRSAFQWLESKVKEGKIRFYGTATWSGYRTEPESEEHLELEDLMVLARETGGTQHHFRAVQLPFNLAMPEAWIFPNQKFGAHQVPFLGLAHRYDLIVAASASLMQSQLTGPFPAWLDPHFKTLRLSSQRAIQFARSVPGMTTALVGMKKTGHVSENLEVLNVPPLTEPELMGMFQSQR